MTLKILVVEDDPTTGEYIAGGLSEAGFTAELISDGSEGLYRASTSDCAAIVLDRMLPGLDGLSVLKALRAANIDTPVLLLSALGELDERVTGLRAGGDDYLVKPFALTELLARMEALLRRRSSSAGTVSSLSCADLVMDLVARKVTRAGRSIALQPREFRLLEYLLRHQNQVVTRTMILEATWKRYFNPQTNVIDVHISRLRQKIDKGFQPPLIHTIRSAGYMLSSRP
jgi:two-component system OmpR family response regulator